jgi:hypothetical protein
MNRTMTAPALERATAMTFDEWKAAVCSEIVGSIIPEEHCDLNPYADYLAEQFSKGADPSVVGKTVAEWIDEWLNYGQYY